MRGRALSREFKLDVVQQIASGVKRPAQVCREHHLAETVLLHWRREYGERANSAWQSWSAFVANSLWRAPR